jgi:hypothetical protein
MEKQCFKCKVTKPLTEFYKHPRMLDGHVNKCKDCNKKDVKGNYSNNLNKPGFIEKERKRGRHKYHRLYTGTGKSNIQASKNWVDKFPEKKKASTMSANLKRPFADCEKHHWSYNEEHYKDVIWLTKKEHMKAHRFIVYDQERKMYRRFDTNVLLDTKDKHNSFIVDCIINLED